jgi:hypothetical protein
MSFRDVRRDIEVAGAKKIKENRETIRVSVNEEFTIGK